MKLLPLRCLARTRKVKPSWRASWRNVFRISGLEEICRLCPNILDIYSAWTTSLSALLIFMKSSSSIMWCNIIYVYSNALEDHHLQLVSGEVLSSGLLLITCHQQSASRNCKHTTQQHPCVVRLTVSYHKSVWNQIFTVPKLSCKNKNKKHLSSNKALIRPTYPNHPNPKIPVLPHLVVLGRRLSAKRFSVGSDTRSTVSNNSGLWVRSKLPVTQKEVQSFHSFIHRKSLTFCGFHTLTTYIPCKIWLNKFQNRCCWYMFDWIEHRRSFQQPSLSRPPIYIMYIRYCIFHIIIEYTYIGPYPSVWHITSVNTFQIFNFQDIPQTAWSSQLTFREYTPQAATCLGGPSILPSNPSLFGWEMPNLQHFMVKPLFHNWMWTGKMTLHKRSAGKEVWFATFSLCVRHF